MNKLLSEVLIFTIGLYKRFISPILPKSCRYYPTCSDYAVLAIKKHGALKGFFLSVWRILRCNPFSKGGIDYP